MTTWHMQYQAWPITPGSSYIDVDMDALCLQLQKAVFSYAAPHYVSFSLAAANHTTPIPRNAFIRLWDSDGTLPDATPQDEDHPFFEGFLEDVNPGDDGISVNYQAYTPDHISAKLVTIFSAAWNEGDIGSNTRPSKAIGAVPRLVTNCANDADDDYAFARNGFGTVGQIIAGILEDQYQPLYWINAAPGDGTNSGNGLAYVWTDELERLTTQPQEKIVNESSTVRAAISQILTRFHPEWRMFWQAGNRQFRFANVIAADQITFTLNDPTSDYKILGVQLMPTTEGRCGAVEYRGPETLGVELFRWDLAGTSNTLVPLGSGTVLEVYTDSGGDHNATAYTRFQIVDSTMRRGGKLLPFPYQLVNGGNIVSYRGPVLQLSFDGGGTWTSTNTWFDHYNGIAYWDQPVYFWSDHTPSGSTQHYFPPNAVRLLWAPYTDPIIVRSPASGFQGTAYTLGGLPAELCQYDEALAVGYEYGTPVTTAYRVGQFQALTDSLLTERQDIGWIGHLVLNGLQYDFLWLGMRVNVTALDSDGNPLTTGWEDINAWLTDIEFDLDKGLTTLTINADQMANLGIDAQLLKQRLQIKALKQVQYSTYDTIIQTMADGLPWISGVKETIHFDYVDPNSGDTEDSTG